MLGKGTPPPPMASVVEPHSIHVGQLGSQTHRDEPSRKLQPEEYEVTGNPGPGVGVLTCPYRRRNPCRFNIRDHQSCATDVFLDMSQVKLHIRTHHLTCLHSLKCPRCQRVFLTLDDVSAHLAVPTRRICELSAERVPINPEDGISFEIDKHLRASSKETGNIFKMWTELWRLLFPKDEKALPPCESWSSLWEILGSLMETVSSH